MSRAAITLGIFLILSSFTRAGELTYRFPPDEVLRYKYVQNETCSYKAKTGKIHEVRALEYVLELRGREVGEYDDPAADATFRDLKHKVVSPEVKYVFDSRKTYSSKAVEKEPILGVFSAMPGESFQISMYGNGSGIRVGKFSNLIGRASARGLFGSRAAGKLLAAVIAKVVNEDAFRTGFGFLFVPFTEGSKRGPEWNAERKSELEGIDETFRITYRFASRGNKKANIVVSGRYILSVDGQPIPKEGTIKGSAVFDVQKGRLLFSKFKTAIKLPNVSLSYAYEFKFLKALDPAEVGPESFEKPLRSMLDLVERRRVKGVVDDFGAPVYATEKAETVLFYVCDKDVVRVVEKREGKDLIRIVTAQGREGWISVDRTEPYK
ncbi:MAG: DUF6263 family protein [Planctomycetota bacterium]|jgi:hypothetical protein